MSKVIEARNFQNHSYKGNNSIGEIEIVEDNESLIAIAEKRKSLLEKTNITNNGLGNVFEDEYIIVKRDPVRFPNGKLGNYLRVIEKPSLNGVTGVVMLPVCGDKIFLIKTFRHPTRTWEIELPRGYRPSEFNVEQAIKVEISEEIGLEVEEIESLGFINPNSGILASTVQAFLVKVKAGNAKPDEKDGEAIEKVFSVSVNELKELISQSKIKDGFTLATIQLAQVKDKLKF
jgi:ADP-ribose pyrophosphatase